MRYIAFAPRLEISINFLIRQPDIAQSFDIEDSSVRADMSDSEYDHVGPIDGGGGMDVDADAEQVSRATLPSSLFSLISESLFQIDATGYGDYVTRKHTYGHTPAHRRERRRTLRYTATFREHTSLNKNVAFLSLWNAQYHLA